MKRPAAIAAAGLLASALGVRAQTPTTAFRAGVEVVDVDVSVLDKNRRPVLDLTAADFTVLEDGKPRPIATFTPVDLAPRELPSAKWLGEVAPDVQTNDLQREGRLVVVLIDRTVAPADADTALRVAEGAIEQLRPADLAAVVFTEYRHPAELHDRPASADRGDPSAGGGYANGWQRQLGLVLLRHLHARSHCGPGRKRPGRSATAEAVVCDRQQHCGHVARRRAPAR